MNTNKKTITLLISIIAISFILDKITYFAISNIEEQVLTGQNVGKFNHYLTIKDSMDLVFFGNSRANHHFNPEVFSKKSFNMGMDSRGLAYYWTAIKMLPENKKQDVIINIDPDNIFSSEYTGKDINALAYKFHKNEKIREEVERRDNITPLINLYWCIGYNSKILGIIFNYLKPKYNYKEHNGYDPIFVTESQKIMREKLFIKSDNAKLVKENIKIKPNEIALNYLELISEYCESNNKSLFIVTAPVRNDKYKNDNSDLKKIMDSLSINYWDYSDFFNGNNNLDLWMDDVHLSDFGANEFSRYLASEIKHKK